MYTHTSEMPERCSALQPRPSSVKDSHSHCSRASPKSASAKAVAADFAAMGIPIASNTKRVREPSEKARENGLQDVIKKRKKAAAKEAVAKKVDKPVRLKITYKNYERDLRAQLLERDGISIKVEEGGGGEVKFDRVTPEDVLEIFSA